MLSYAKAANTDLFESFAYGCLQPSVPPELDFVLSVHSSGGLAVLAVDEGQWQSYTCAVRSQLSIRVRVKT